MHVCSGRINILVGHTQTEARLTALPPYNDDHQRCLRLVSDRPSSERTPVVQGRHGSASDSWLPPRATLPLIRCPI